MMQEAEQYDSGMSAALSTALWAEEDRARADHYALFARLFFCAPDQALLDMLTMSGEVLGIGEGALPVAWRALGHMAGQTTVGAVQEEFAALFVSVSKPVVILNGSWYLTGFLQEEPLVQLRDDLVELGLGRRSGVTDTEDHISALAEVMRHLILTGPDEAGLARQKQFFNRHLAPWGVQFTEALQQAPGGCFYVKAGELLRAFLEVERAAFEMV